MPAREIKPGAGFFSNKWRCPAGDGQEAADGQKERFLGKRRFLA
jgi:hypothetical protein